MAPISVVMLKCCKIRLIRNPWNLALFSIPKKFYLLFKLSLLCWSCPKSARASNVLRMLQISSKSVYFWC